MDYELRENCLVYLHSNNSNCSIPCKTSGCERELHHYISCPIWSCVPFLTTTTVSTTTNTLTTTTTYKTTTRTTTQKTTTQTTKRTTTQTTKRTTTQMPTTTPSTQTTTSAITPITLKPLPPIDHPIYLISSISLNVFLFCLLSTVMYFKCKKAILRQWNRLRRTDQDPERNPILPPRTESRSNSNRTSHFSITERDSTSEDEDSIPHRPIVFRNAASPPSFTRSPPNLPTRSSSLLNSSLLNTPLSRLLSTNDEGRESLQLSTFRPGNVRQMSGPAGRISQDNFVSETFL